MRYAFVLGLSCVMMAGAVEAKPAPSVVEIPADGRVDGMINGRPARFWVSPKGSKVPLLNPDAAKRAGLSPGWLKAAMTVGPVRIPANTGVVRYSVPATDLKRRVGWMDRPVAPRADALIGPGGIAAPVVVFRIGPTRPGEHVTRMPLIDRGYSGLKSAIKFGKELVSVDWRLDDDASVATASAGAFLGQVLDGRFSGATFQRHVFAGVSRPHRTMNLGLPLVVAGRRIDQILVRTSGDDREGSDPDEIVVVAKGKGEKKTPRSVTLGGDALRGCSTLTFDKPRKEIRLSCL